MKITRTAIPALAVLSAFGLSACQKESSAPATKTVTASATPEQSQDSSSASAPESSSTEATSESAPSDSSTSESSASAPSSSSSSGGQKVTAADLTAFAKTHETRACKVADLSYILGGAQFCKSDSDDVTATYSGQRLYITTAVEYDSGAAYSYTATNGSRSQTKTFDASSLKNGRSGSPMSLAVTLPMESGGSYKVTFKKGGKEFATKNVTVSVD